MVQHRTSNANVGGSNSIREFYHKLPIETRLWRVSASFVKISLFPSLSFVPASRSAPVTGQFVVRGRQRGTFLKSATTKIIKEITTTGYSIQHKNVPCYVMDGVRKKNAGGYALK